MPLAAKNLVIVDMDGTLADVSHRLHHIRGRYKNWGGFFHTMADDPPVEVIRTWVRKLEPEFEVVIMTGRPEQYRAVTEDWLRRYDIPYHTLLMRQKNDHRPDHVVKNELLHTLDLARVAFVIDDRSTVCDMFRNCGLRVFQVRAGEES